MNTTHKVCTKCGQEKEVTEFYKQRGKYLRPNCKACENERSRTYHHANREARVQKIRDYGLISRSGITREQYDKLLRKQRGKCAICREAETMERRLAVDHDHKCCPGKKSCGKCVRGLLCGNCNNGLGRFKDDVRLLARAIHYLESQ